MALPATHKVLIQEKYAERLELKTVPVPQVTPGAAIVRVLSTLIVPYTRDVLNGKRAYSYPNPMIPGSLAVVRIEAVGPDATLLAKGDLALFNCLVCGRDDPDAVFLVGASDGNTAGSRKLMEGEWRHGTFAEYAKLPLENLFVLDERWLCGTASKEDGGFNRGLGYSFAQLNYIGRALVPYGGLRSVQLQAGETVIIAPATGGFGSAGVVTALAMGARVIAMGRDEKKLAQLKEVGEGRVETVVISDDYESLSASLKKFGPVDVFLDLSPAAAGQSPHIKAGIMSLRRGGRVSLMGGPRQEVSFPYRAIMRYNIRLQGMWMYDRSDVVAMIRLVQAGQLNLHKVTSTVKVFRFEDWETALDQADRVSPINELVVFE